jgi:hypothetical protein
MGTLVSLRRLPLSKAGNDTTFTFGDDATSKKFFYDTRGYLASPSIDIANFEMAMNGLMKNGRTESDQRIPVREMVKHFGRCGRSGNSVEFY